MDAFLYFYQNLPRYIDPVAFSLGPFPIRWYSLMYIAAFLTVYLLILYRIQKKEVSYSKDFLENIFLASFLGLLIGARLGYVFFYDPDYFLKNPLAIFYPFNPENGEFSGIFGMSYHGGLVGVILASWTYTWLQGVNFLKLANFIAPAVPAGYFFGRIGNFLNGELFGKITGSSWGMHFGLDNFLRYPNQLCEAFFEGIVLFVLLWTLRNNPKSKDKMLFGYLLGYGIFRFLLDFGRESHEKSLLGFLEISQLLSLSMAIIGLFLLLFSRVVIRRKMG